MAASRRARFPLLQPPGQHLPEGVEPAPAAQFLLGGGALRMEHPGVERVTHRLQRLEEYGEWTSTVQRGELRRSVIAP